MAGLCEGGNEPPVSKVMVFIKEPSMEDRAFDIFSPFKYNLWFSILAAVLVLYVVISSISCVYGCYGGRNVSEQYNFYSAWLYLLGSCCQQGNDKVPLTWSGRVVYLTSYLTVLIMYFAYTATFISFLNVKRFSLPFDDFKGLLEDGTYKIRMPHGSARVIPLQVI
ncbi:hypothetical protein ANN_20897 [Periplaneta americana]|uniref:Ionotropic glutamate receptor C-terminal domain-containing protein n=1 Tax=Periplaneta americana TaxID=6978 RepID=A0ABQ8SDW0_PERAM|nr:hypothetical protein ANN_20897 [Periplaneta americana]